MMDENWSKRSRRAKLILQIVFWGGYLFFVSVVMTELAPLRIAVLRTCSMAIIHAILVYLNLYLLLPRLFDTRRFVAYGAGVVVLIVVSIPLRLGVDYLLAKEGSLLHEYLFSVTHFLAAGVSGLVMILISSFLRLIDEWYKKHQLGQELKNQQLEAEFKFLKAQVNPHFLFNTLNNIYSLALLKSDQTPEMILKLSEMMRYMLYDCKAESVELEKEVLYLKNFITLHQLKMEEEQTIRFEVIGNTSGVSVPPLLFIPFFENAIKHGNLEELGKGWLHSKLIVSEGVVRFFIENTYSMEARKDKTGGIGLENIRQQLRLLFPDKHELKIGKEDDLFRVELMINLT